MKPAPTLVCLALLATALPASAAMKTGEMSPRPNVAVRDVSVALAFNDDIADEVLVRDPGIRKLQVEGFRTAVEAGFDYAFTTGPGYSVMLNRAEVGLVAGAVDGDGDVVAATSQVTYQATVTADETGDTCTVAGTARAKRTISNAKHVGAVVESALESMIEAIASECVAPEE